MRILAAFFCTILALGAAPPDGGALYRERCGICHDGKPQARMPTRDELAARAPEAVLRAMLGGAGYEIEFVTLAGETVSVVTVPAEAVRPVRAKEIAHARIVA